MKSLLAFVSNLAAAGGSRLKAANGEIVADSAESYSSLEAVRKAAERVKNNAGSATIDSSLPTKERPMARGWVHTVHKGTWINEVEGEGVLSRHMSKDEAVAAGRRAAIARRTEHVIHNLDGTIAERNSYGNDPYPPRG